MRDNTEYAIRSLQWPFCRLKLTTSQGGRSKLKRVASAAFLGESAIPQWKV
jgi:hypothetical protein